MSSTPVSTPSSSQGPPTLGEADASCRWLAWFFLSKAAFWGVLGSFLLLLASVKLHAPSLLSGQGWLTYGRILPAGWNAFVYGFAGQAGFAVALWVLVRAARQRLQAPFLIGLGGVCWNLGILGGVVGILAGHSTGREWLEMPVWSMAFVVIGAGFIGAAGWITYAARTEERTYPSAWFVLLGLLAFVWVGTVALTMLGNDGARGVVQVAIQRWYAGGVVNLWLGAFAAALLFHFLPLVVNRPLASRPLALMGFWSLVVFTPWATTMHGDPFPRWIVSLGMAGQALGMIGVVAIALNWWKTTEGAARALFATMTGRLLGAAAIAYLAASTIRYLTGLPEAASVLRFTWIHQGLDWLWVGGALGFALVAVLPEFAYRATGKVLDARLTTWHARFTLIGVGTIAVSLILAGAFQGLGLAWGLKPFVEATGGSLHLVRLSTLGYVVLFLGQLAFMMAMSGLCKAMANEWATGCKAWWTTPASDRRMGVPS